METPPASSVLDQSQSHSLWFPHWILCFSYSGLFLEVCMPLVQREIDRQCLFRVAPSFWLSDGSWHAFTCALHIYERAQWQTLGATIKNAIWICAIKWWILIIFCSAPGTTCVYDRLILEFYLRDADWANCSENKWTHLFIIHFWVQLINLAFEERSN